MHFSIICLYILSLSYFPIQRKFLAKYIMLFSVRYVGSLCSSDVSRKKMHCAFECFTRKNSPTKFVMHYEICSAFFPKYGQQRFKGLSLFHYFLNFPRFIGVSTSGREIEGFSISFVTSRASFSVLFLLH